MLESISKSSINNLCTKLDHKLIMLDIDLLVRNSLHKLASDISDSLLLAEVTCLYKNKIYNDKAKKNLSCKIDCISRETNLIISRYLEIVKGEIRTKLSTIS